MATEYTEFVFVAEDGSFYREAEVRSWDSADVCLPEGILVPQLCPKPHLAYCVGEFPRLSVIDRMYRRIQIKSYLPLTNELVREFVSQWMAALEKKAAPGSNDSWDWEEPD